MKTLTALLVFLLSVIVFAQADLTINLLIRDNPFPPYGDSEIISFGLDSTATDGIDEYLGESALPPDFCPNLAGVFCANFIVPTGEDSQKDFRFGTLPFTGQKIHKIHCMAMDTSYVIIYNLPLGITANLTDLAGGIIFSATITDSGQIVIPNLAGGFLYKLWMYVNYDNVIPVEFTSFTASVLQNEKAVQLNWSTATETNNSGFEIHRSAQNDNEWQAIGFVPGFGTTTEPKAYFFTDENVSTGMYKYRLKQIDFDGTFTYSNEIEGEVDFTPKEFVLYQNYPNPFNPSTTIKFTVPSVIASEAKQSQFVTLKVYDILGNEVATLVNEEKQPGVYKVEFNINSVEGRNLPSGVYFYQSIAKGPETSSGQSFVQTKKMVLLK